MDQLHGNGRIYLVQLGPNHGHYSLEDLAAWLHTKYNLDVQLLPDMALDPSTWNPVRHQYVAELLYDRMKSEHPQLADDPNAYLIGFTDASMFSVYHDWSSSFTQRDMQRSAVVSSSGMEDRWWERMGVSARTSDRRLQQRLRRILLKDVAMLYWHLPVNNDPTSLLHQTMDPDLPANDIYASDLEPQKTIWGEFQGEPCIFLRYSPKQGIRPEPGELIHECTEVQKLLPKPTTDELFELDLRLGLLIDRHTDFHLPDSIPIDFERVTRDGWTGPMAFGLSGTHNYDRFLGSNDMVTIDVIQNDGGRYHLGRLPRWLPVLALNRYVDEGYSGNLLELRWAATPFEHFDLKRFNGETETYLPCGSSDLCYQVGFRDSSGKVLEFQRDTDRRLTRLASPGGKWIALRYGTAGHIREIEDSTGRIVSYTYDDKNRLTGVTYPSGEIYSYTYDDNQHLLTFSVAPDAQTAPTVMLRNSYDHNRVASQTLADGTVFRYSYRLRGKDTIQVATIGTPEGKTLDVFMIGDRQSAIRERTSEPPPKFSAANHRPSHS